MALWNLQALVVEVIDAPSAEVAYKGLTARLRAAGFEVNDDARETSIAEAFESEPVPCPERDRRGRSCCYRQGHNVSVFPHRFD